MHFVIQPYTFATEFLPRIRLILDLDPSKGNTLEHREYEGLNTESEGCCWVGRSITDDIKTAPKYIHF